MNADSWICQKKETLQAKVNALALDAIRDICSFPYYNNPKVKVSAIDGVICLMDKITEEIETTVEDEEKLLL